MQAFQYMKSQFAGGLHAPLWFSLSLFVLSSLFPYKTTVKAHENTWMAEQLFIYIAIKLFLYTNK